VASTDQRSVSVFKLSPPGATVPDTDLSQLSTGLGVRIGSTYEELLAAYGGKPRNRTGRFVIIFAATVHGSSVAHHN
jgi:hypothetical protein